MPVFDLSDWPQVPTAVAGYRILATMIYPDDERQREELYDTLITENVLSAADTCGTLPNPHDSAELLRLLRARHRGPSAPQVRKTARHAYIKGYTAGEILYLIYWLRESGCLNGVDKGGVGKTCYMLVQLAKQNMNRSYLTLLPLPCERPKALRDNVWSPYKSVAHLWAAQLILIQANMMVSAQEICVPYEQWFVVPRDFLTFLGLAEYFRQFGEGHLPHGQRTALLVPEDTWHLPPDMALSNRDPVQLPPLPEPFQQALKTYRARNMR